MFTLQEKCCGIMLTFFLILSAVQSFFFFYLQCTANAVSRMLVGTAFYLIHRFAHTLKFQNDDVLNIAKVYSNMYIFSSR